MRRRRRKIVKISSGISVIARIAGIVAVVSSLWSAGCGKRAAQGGFQAAAGLPPVAYLVKRVGGDALTVHTMLPEGRSPHDYSPGPREVRDARASALFFTTGMNFEKRLTAPLGKGSTRVCDASRGIRRIPQLVSCGHDHHEHHKHHDHCEHHDHHHHDEEALDPHVWLSVDNACRMAENIRDDLAAADPARAGIYRENCRKLVAELRECENELKTRLRPYAGRRFYVYHPAFGYFAKMLDLRQEAVELGGREVTASRLPEIIRAARRDNVRTIFTQPQFNPAAVAALERELKVRAVPADPLREDLLENFYSLGRTLAAGFADGEGGGR